MGGDNIKMKQKRTKRKTRLEIKRATYHDDECYKYQVDKEISRLTKPNSAGLQLTAIVIHYQQVSRAKRQCSTEASY